MQPCPLPRKQYLAVGFDLIDCGHNPYSADAIEVPRTKPNIPAAHFVDSPCFLDPQKSRDDELDESDERI